MSEKIKFAERMKMLRGQRTQMEMASYLNVTQTAYAYWETGKRQPKLDLLAFICQRMNVSADWLLGLNDLPQRPEPSIGEKLAALKAQAERTKESIDQVMVGIKSLEQKV